jgi:serine/threonine protein kinase
MYRCAPNDVWCLGVVLVNLTCGRNPWKQASPLDAGYLAYLEDHEWLKSILPISNELYDILVTIFEPDAEKRITTEELITAVATCPTFSKPLVTL